MASSIPYSDIAEQLIREARDAMRSTAPGSIPVENFLKAPVSGRVSLQNLPEQKLHELVKVVDKLWMIKPFCTKTCYIYIADTNWQNLLRGEGTNILGSAVSSNSHPMPTIASRTDGMKESSERN